MSPRCTTNESGCAFISSISRSRRSTSSALYGASPSTPNASSPCASGASGVAHAASQTLNAVSLAQERKRMALLDACGRFAHALHDVARGDRAVRAYVMGIRLGHLAEHRAADLHGVLEVLGLHAPSAVVARAALDDLHLRAWNRLEHLARLLSHVLYARMARDVIGDASERVLEIGPEQPVFLAQHEVLERIEHRIAHRRRIRIVRIHERQLLLEHQRARRYRREDGVALARVPREHRHVLLLQRIDAVQVAQLELRHAAARFLLD